MGPGIYLLAIGVSWLSVPACLMLFILIPVYYIFPSRIDQHWGRRSTNKGHKAEVSGISVEQ